MATEIMLQRSPMRRSNVRQLRRGGDGLYLQDLAAGTVVEIKTQHHSYRLVKDDDTQVSISGHPTYCPEPIVVELEGSLGKDLPLKATPGFIGCGMHLVLKHPLFDRITTGKILEIYRC